MQCLAQAWGSPFLGQKEESQANSINLFTPYYSFVKGITRAGR